MALCDKYIWVSQQFYLSCCWVVSKSESFVKEDFVNPTTGETQSGHSWGSSLCLNFYIQQACKGNWPVTIN